MKKILFCLSIISLSFCFILSVNATSINTNSSIEMPKYIMYDADNIFKLSETNSSYYEIENVTDNSTIVDLIDDINLLKEYLKNETENNKTTIENSITSKQSELKAAISDYNSEGFILFNNNTIPMSKFSADNYYVIWVKTTSNGSDIYNYGAYKATSSANVDNPDTGIETTFLYLAVGITLVVGIYLTITKNKEKYE